MGSESDCPSNLSYCTVWKITPRDIHKIERRVYLLVGGTGLCYDPKMDPAGQTASVLDRVASGPLESQLAEAVRSYERVWNRIIHAEGWDSDMHAKQYQYKALIQKYADKVDAYQPGLSEQIKWRTRQEIAEAYKRSDSYLKDIEEYEAYLERTALLEK